MPSERIFTQLVKLVPHPFVDVVRTPVLKHHFHWEGGRVYALMQTPKFCQPLSTPCYINLRPSRCATGQKAIVQSFAIFHCRHSRTTRTLWTTPTPRFTPLGRRSPRSESPETKVPKIPSTRNPQRRPHSTTMRKRMKVGSRPCQIHTSYSILNLNFTFCTMSSSVFYDQC